MTSGPSSLSTRQAVSNTALSQYEPLGTNEVAMPDLVLANIFSYLGPASIIHSVSVCKTWRQVIVLTKPWERYMPECDSYEKFLRLVSSRIAGKGVCKDVLGATFVEPVPRIPESISLDRWNEPDPCDLANPDKKIGTEYVWMYCGDIYITVPGDSPLCLDKEDPNDPEADAPRLIQRKVSLIERARRAVGLGANSENRVLKVPMTVNNMKPLFEHPKKGNPSTYRNIGSEISKQHGNKRISGWVCMRRGMIGEGLPFAEQQTLADTHGLVIPRLQERILFNFLEHARSEANVYPDGEDPWTYARTSTVTRDEEGNNWPSGCGAGGPSGLHVYSRDHFLDHDYVGVAVALPAEA